MFTGHQTEYALFDASLPLPTPQSLQSRSGLFMTFKYMLVIVNLFRYPNLSSYYLLNCSSLSHRPIHYSICSADLLSRLCHLCTIQFFASFQFRLNTFFFYLASLFDDFLSISNNSLRKFSISHLFFIFTICKTIPFYYPGCLSSFLQILFSFSIIPSFRWFEVLYFVIHSHIIIPS